MNSQERVLTAFAHEPPDRVPVWCGASTEFWLKAKDQLSLDDEGLRNRFGDDFRRVFAGFTGPTHTLENGTVCPDCFGVQRSGLGYGQPTSHPLAQATLNEVHDYPWPDPNWCDPTPVKTEARKYNRQFAILGGDWAPFWHDLIDLLGMENLYLKMYDQPELVDAVLEHIVDYYFAVNQRIFDAAADEIDIFFFGNDLGSQTGPLLGVDLFRRFILPHLVRLIDLGHAYHLKVMLHCCGGFAPLIPSLIEARLDGLHAVQPCCRGMDLTTLKSTFGGKILFNGAIDSHHVLINGTPEYVAQQTRQVLEIMKPDGGYIAGASHDTILAETPLENVLAMFDTIRQYGKYTD